MQVEVEKMKALGNLAATALDKTNAFKAAGDYLFGSSGPSGSAAAGGGAVGAVAGVIREAGAGVANKVKQWVTGSNTGWTEIKPQGNTPGWTYYQGGKDTMAISDKGSVYINGSLVADDQLAYVDRLPSEVPEDWSRFPNQFEDWSTADFSFGTDTGTSNYDWSNYNYSGVSE
jgi:hypothetical protein